MADYTDPRPNLPPHDTVVLIRGEDGSTRYGTHSRYQGWREWPVYWRWSAAHPVVVGWKLAAWPPKTEEEFSAASRGMSAERIASWRNALPQLEVADGVDQPDGTRNEGGA